MGKAVTLDLSEFIGKRLDSIVDNNGIGVAHYYIDVIDSFIVLCRHILRNKLKGSIINIIPKEFRPNPEPKYNRFRSNRRHIYICLIVTTTHNYILQFASKYIIQYITIGNLVYKRNDKIWEKQE